MAGIVGIQNGDKQAVARMLSRISHRGNAGDKIIEGHDVTLGAVWPEAQISHTPRFMRQNAVWDAKQPPLPDPAGLAQERAPFALASTHISGELFLARDTFGVSPLYYGYTDAGRFCFASEVKALREVTENVTEFPRKNWYTPKTGFREYRSLESTADDGWNVEEVARGLQLRLERAVCQHISGDEMGAWLSGGLDSSAIVAFARPYLKVLHTFAAGMAGAPDLQYAQKVAEYFDTQHHPIIVSMEDMLRVLPDVIYHLESFDALLVRSAVTNYLVAEQAAKYVDVSFSGEGADELFAGYGYMHQLSSTAIEDELGILTGKLHNTSLQRVDRSAAAHGLVVHVPFLDPEVAAYAQTIPVQIKMRQKPESIEKYILRRALVGILPDSVLWRRKTKFWQGTGMGDLLAEYAEEKISQSEFARERALPNGWELNSKEELFYYRILKDKLGNIQDFNWMGRTRGAPKTV
jgi:asparagine synthase (glutamine-hydrolysing)